MIRRSAPPVRTWPTAQDAFVFPIIGGRKVEHLKQNVQALDISLSPEQIQRIDNAKPFESGFPYNVIVRTS